MNSNLPTLFLTLLIDVASSSIPAACLRFVRMLFALGRELDGDGVRRGLRPVSAVSIEIGVISTFFGWLGPPNSDIQSSTGICNLPEMVSGYKATTFAGLILSARKSSIAASNSPRLNLATAFKPRRLDLLESCGATIKNQKRFVVASSVA